MLVVPSMSVLPPYCIHLHCSSPQQPKHLEITVHSTGALLGVCLRIFPLSSFFSTSFVQCDSHARSPRQGLFVSQIPMHSPFRQRPYTSSNNAPHAATSSSSSPLRSHLTQLNVCLLDDSTHGPVTGGAYGILEGGGQHICHLY